MTTFLSRPRARLARCICLAAALCCGLVSAQAQLTQPRFVYYPDRTPASAQPSWVREIPSPDGLEHARRDFQIVPPRAGLELAITIAFSEGEEPGTLQAYFRSARTGREVATNLFDDIGLPNQRTIVLRKRLLDAPGVLSLIAKGPELRLLRMEFQWLQVRPVLVPVCPILESPAAILGDGTVLHYDEIASSETRPPQEKWLDSVIRFPLVHEPQRIESGVEFVFDLDGPPNLALITLELAGLPPQTQVRVMANGQVAGWLQVELPSLAHASYRTPQALQGATEIVGWRSAQGWLPREILKEGENVLWLEFFEPAAEADAANPGLQPVEVYGVALRHLTLELDYPHAPVLGEPAAAEVPADAATAPDPAPEAAAATTSTAEGTSEALPVDDSIEREQSSASPVISKGEFSYDLMGDMAPALQLFMDEAPAQPETAP